MNHITCPKCQCSVPASRATCAICAAPLPPAVPDGESPETSSRGVSYEKAGFGAMGNVDIRHDASRHHSETHHENSVHNHYYPQPPAASAAVAPATQEPSRHSRHSPVLVIVIPLSVGLAGLSGFAWWQSKKHGNPPTAPYPSVVINNLPNQNSSATVSPQPESRASSSARSALKAEAGRYFQGTFHPGTQFKAGDLLTLRLTLDRPSHARVLYFQANGEVLRLFPEKDGDSGPIGPGEIFIPDPKQLEERAPDATAFQLTHEPGSGPAIHERLFIQTADSPFTDEGSNRDQSSPYRTYGTIPLADARTRGVNRLKGTAAVQAQSQSDQEPASLVLPLEIKP